MATECQGTEPQAQVSSWGPLPGSGRLPEQSLCKSLDREQPSSVPGRCVRLKQTTLRAQEGPAWPMPCRPRLPSTAAGAD